MAYMIRLLTGELPNTEKEFLERVKDLFPEFCDLKYLKWDLDHLRGSLDDLTKDLGISREGTSH